MPLHIEEVCQIGMAHSKLNAFTFEQAAQVFSQIAAGKNLASQVYMIHLQSPSVNNFASKGTIFSFIQAIRINQPAIIGHQLLNHNVIQFLKIANKKESKHKIYFFRHNVLAINKLLSVFLLFSHFSIK